MPSAVVHTGTRAVESQRRRAHATRQRKVILDRRKNVPGFGLEGIQEQLLLAAIVDVEVARIFLGRGTGRRPGKTRHGQSGRGFRGARFEARASRRSGARSRNRPPAFRHSVNSAQVRLWRRPPHLSYRGKTTFILHRLRQAAFAEGKARGFRRAAAESQASARALLRVPAAMGGSKAGTALGQALGDPATPDCAARGGRSRGGGGRCALQRRRSTQRTELREARRRAARLFGTPRMMVR